MIRTLRRTWNRLLGSLFGQRRESELAEELDSHIQLLTGENIQRGVPPDEALRLARLHFGSVESTKESYRDQRGLQVLDAFAQDLRYAFRGMHRNPGFATAAILSLAIGIGANTAIFSLVNSVLLKPLAYKDPQRVFAVGELLPHFFGQNPIGVNPTHARAWAQQCPSLEQVALMRGNRADVAVGGEPASFPSADVTRNLFSLLGVEPILGRTFLPEEEQQGSHRVVVLSESLWRSRFHADRRLVGKSILIDRENYQVIGILPAWFRLPYGVASDMNVPFEIFRPLVLGREEIVRLMGNFNYTAVLRLKRGKTADQALAEINVVQAQFPRLAGSTDRELKAKLTPVHEFVTGRARLGLWMLAAAVGAVLLIVCINLANLLLSRITSRSREAAIRTALGASRGRQFRMVLTETLLLALSGGALGILFAGWIVHLLVTTTTLDIPRLDEVGLDASVLLFAFCLTVLTGLVFGALPAWRLTRNDPQEALRAGSHTVTEGRRRSALSRRTDQPRSRPERGVAYRRRSSRGQPHTTAASRQRIRCRSRSHRRHRPLGQSLRGRRSRSTGKSSLTVFSRKSAPSPVSGPSGIVTGPAHARPNLERSDLPRRRRPSREDRHPVDNRYASPGYFRTMNIAVLRGRAFEESDRGQGVAVLSEKAAKLLWPGEPNPVAGVLWVKTTSRRLWLEWLPKCVLSSAATRRRWRITPTGSARPMASP